MYHLYVFVHDSPVRTEEVAVSERCHAVDGEMFPSHALLTMWGHDNDVWQSPCRLIHYHASTYLSLRTGDNPLRCPQLLYFPYDDGVRVTIGSVEIIINTVDSTPIKWAHLIDGRWL